MLNRSRLSRCGTEPSKFAAQFHNRMPLVLGPDTWDVWLKGYPEAAAALYRFNAYMMN
jgi:putative SOS response-associated peptidase YedK